MLLMNPDEQIPAEVANQFWAIFSVPLAEIDRADISSGMSFKEFDKILFSSPFIFVIDWRAELSEELQIIAAALKRLDVTLNCEYGVDGDTAILSCEERIGVHVSYRPNDDEGSFHNVINELQRLVPEHIEFREYRPANGSDTNVFAVLPEKAWMEFRGAAAELSLELFIPLIADATQKSESRWPAFRKVWDFFEHVICVILFLSTFIALRWPARAFLGPGNIFEDYGATEAVLFGALSIVEYDALTRWIFGDDGEESDPWYGSQLILGGVIVCLLLAACVETYERVQSQRALTPQRPSTPSPTKQIRDLMNDPKVQEGMKKAQEIRKRKQEEKEKSETSPADD